MRIRRTTWAVGAACLMALGCGDDSGGSADDTPTDAMGTEESDMTDATTDGSDVMTDEPDVMTDDMEATDVTTDVEATDTDGAQTDVDMPEPKDPAEADVVEVDRFSEDAATLMVRTEDNGLPGPNEPVDFDMGPFITQGLGPNGEMVQYYNFDVQPTEPAPIYVLRYEDESAVEGQLNVVDVVPGDEGYNDFWQVVFVTVPDGYEANTYTSVSELEDAELGMMGTEVLVNCPVVPEGSTAEMRYEGDDTGLHQGWYEGMVVNYFTFGEAALMGETVPLSPIYVAFNINPDEDGGGPASGFVVEEGSMQTHNVVATVPGDEGYSPLWLVNIYDNADFDSVSDLDSAMAAGLLATGAATVNCPIVSVQ